MGLSICIEELSLNPTPTIVCTEGFKLWYCIYNCYFPLQRIAGGIDILSSSSRQQFGSLKFRNMASQSNSPFSPLF